MRRLHVSLLGLAVVAAAVSTPASASASSSDDGASGPRVVAGAFSPNGDGRDDTLLVRYVLPRDADRVELTIDELYAGPTDHVRVVRLGRVEQGSHSWTFDGRNGNGTIVDDGTYRVSLSYAGSPAAAGNRLVVDTSFSPRLAVDSGAIRLAGVNPAVYPRTSVVRDALHLSGLVEHRTRRVSLTIRNPRGRVVLRKVKRNVKGPAQVYSSVFDERWTARVDGRPLPPGRYRAVIAGVDRVGNRGRVEQPIWVSKERLVWHEEVRTVRPQGSEGGGACFFDGGAGCSDAETFNPPCGTVTASQLYAGGLSYRSAPCPEGRTGNDRAGMSHWLPFPQAPRGVARARVRFVGAPTHAGEGDVGTLSVSATAGQQSSFTTSATGSETADVTPRYGLGVDGDTSGSADPIPPGVLWGFSTTSGNAVDVQEFVVTARYLAVED
ncbi:FlgD immunoglobulin-like domain containing protein [Nocardioides baculatus]|uniref:FlgD/Vpr Ig-like domain-containing protein n=1 Tax=Nocardioides baculatus TaxID=2801337 RepID=A0ABS1LDD8_9ACTN|nr:FlgD immunoglobulin-like domain containing protein [Nocardioides baculatus]MBL0749700.1 hypothetical protein [Nocardioides baculatus]